ncbi:MAG: hypothetical protein K8F91_11500 [Candidatus Obscuribacterales bacterium]|nr:hypothetical protein [Candidatus Obscuribacterales bacterium]
MDASIFNIVSVLLVWFASVAILTLAVSFLSGSIVLTAVFLLRTKAFACLTGGLWSSGLTLCLISMALGFGLAFLSP